MNIHEYQAKGLLKDFGAPVLKGGVAYTAAEAVDVAKELGGPVWVVKAQIHAGGRGEPIELDAHMKKVAVKAAKAVGAELCGVDILEGLKGPLVLEVNISPGLQGITQFTGVDIADKIAKHLFDKTDELDKEKKGKSTSKIMDDLKISSASGGSCGDIISELNFRSNRILLPEIVTGLSNFKENEEYVIKVENGVVSISCLNCSEK